MALDKITPLAAPPGHSLTGPRGKWPWERPPQIVDPNEAVDFIIERTESMGEDESFAKMMLAGITVEEIVSQIAFKGFMAGMFTPDVAELIKPALSIYLVGLAEENGIEAKLFVTDPELEEKSFNDAAFFRTLKQRNPKLYRDMVEIINEEKRMRVDNLTRPAPAPAPAPEPSFLNPEE